MLESGENTASGRWAHLPLAVFYGRLGFEGIGPRSHPVKIIKV
jgi:hypothetical protein